MKRNQRLRSCQLTNSWTNIIFKTGARHVDLAGLELVIYIWSRTQNSPAIMPSCLSLTRGWDKRFKGLSHHAWFASRFYLSGKTTQMSNSRGE